MASLKEVRNRHGQIRYRVQFETASLRAWKDHRTFDEACRHLYLAESERFGDMSSDERERSRDWTLKKLLQFFLGKKINQVEQGRFRSSSLVTVKSSLLSIDAQLQSRLALKVRPSEVRNLPDLTRSYLHSAYLHLAKLRGKGGSPVIFLKTQQEKPVPVFDNVEEMISAAPVREKIAILLAARCALRRSEILALNYADIKGKYISVTKRLTAAGVLSGLKRDTQRLIPLPDELPPLLDKRKIGSQSPLIARQRDGGRLSLNYTTAGVMKKLLLQFGIKNFHNLRHHAALAAIEKGNELNTVSRMLGHADIATTVRVYGRFSSHVLQVKY